MQTTELISNFSFLEEHEPLLLKLGSQAERYFNDDPSTCLIKLRQYAEILAQKVALKLGVSFTTADDFVSVLNLLRHRGVEKLVLDLFHGIRKKGNVAVHDAKGNHTEALHQLKMARVLGEWYVRLLTKDHGFNAPAFVPPPNPSDATKEFLEQLEALRKKLSESESAAQAKAEEASVWQRKARQSEELLTSEIQRFSEQIAQMSQSQRTEPQTMELLLKQANAAADNLTLDEADTRRIIDDQLRNAGWEADSEVLRYGKGTRPQKGRSLAIAEWPTSSGPVDYALFIGLNAVGVIEAKRWSRSIPGLIDKAKRYSRDFQFNERSSPSGGPWSDYKVPFLFATNGRPYLRQLLEQSGVWFLDARRSTNHSRALDSWYTPQGLLDLLEIDEDESYKSLKQTSSDYLPLRDYQRRMIESVERALEGGQREILIAMATGTGKTRTCVCLLYRLLKAKRFQRILFLVDREPLGEQAENTFKELRLESMRTLAEIYQFGGLDDPVPDRTPFVEVATIQSLVRRLFYSENPLPVDSYDCIVVDECHRGYTLDRELSETELRFRSEEEYISKYRRVLDHFDAVKIGLTATPALHTIQIFGEPVDRYSYREAVVDDWLIDHEPPIRLVTALSEDGMYWAAGGEMKVFEVGSQRIDTIHLEDEVNIEVQDFNKRVITENFNKVVCEELAKYIDPQLEGKTLIFADNDDHADMIVRLLKDAMTKAYGSIDDSAIAKITFKQDERRELIRRFKNEIDPRIVVTVDLLTTGIDVPAIVNLVFVRRVKSRILYEQMLGRATRRCPEIEKEVFRIFDAVDLYAEMQRYSEMRPVVANAKLSFSMLGSELAIEDSEIQKTVVEQIVAKLQRKKRNLKSEKHDQVQAICGLTVGELIDLLRGCDVTRAVNFIKQNPKLLEYLDAVTADGRRVVISEHDDEIRRVERGYGSARRPEDYLDSFAEFIRNNLNEIPALMVAAQRPRDLTRQQLRELVLELDRHGFNETNLEIAWKEMTNAEIAASIVGFIRQRAIGSALVPYSVRVDRALSKILVSQTWTETQRRWLQRIAKQIEKEIVVDREALNRAQFAAEGGFDRLNKVFGGTLETLLAEFHDEIWKDSA